MPITSFVSVSRTVKAIVAARHAREYSLEMLQNSSKEAIIDLLEYANTQLLEFRYYDELLTMLLSNVFSSLEGHESFLSRWRLPRLVLMIFLWWTLYRAWPREKPSTSATASPPSARFRKGAI